MQKQASGTAGYIVTWHHLECCRVEGLGATELAPLIYFEEAVAADPAKRTTVLDTVRKSLSWSRLDPRPNV